MHVLERLNFEAQAIPAEESFQRLIQLTTRHPFLKGLSPESLSRVIEEMSYREYPCGHCFFSEGVVNDFFSLIESGEVEVTSPSATETRGRGASLGDDCLFAVSKPAQATAIARSKVGVWTIDGGVYRFVVVEASKQRHDALKAFVDSLPWQIDRSQFLEEVLEASQILSFAEHEVVLPESRQARAHRLLLPPFAPGQRHLYLVKAGSFSCDSKLLSKHSAFLSEALEPPSSPSASSAHTSSSAPSSSVPSAPSSSALSSLPPSPSSEVKAPSPVLVPASVVCASEGELVLLDVARLASLPSLLSQLPCTIHLTQDHT